MSIPLTEYIASQARARLPAKPFESMGLVGSLIEFAAWNAQTFVASGNVVEQIRKQVRRGSLIATGVRVAPSFGSSPVQIPVPAFANGRILYLKNTLVTVDARYTDLRLIAKNAVTSVNVV